MVELSDPSAGDKLEELAAGYDRRYVQANYFQYRTWVYRPFIKAIIKRVRLAKGSRLLDAGCGQGFFTSLFAECGMKALGVDVSPEGVRQARKNYGAMPNAEFTVGDVCRLAYKNEFDCVYSRSCSLYNRDNFAEDRSVSDALLKYVKPGGVLIFDYYTNLCPRKKSAAWIYHSVAAARKHFSRYPGGKVYFSLRVDTLLLGSRSFSLSAFNIVAGRFTGIGGDLVAIVPKRSSS